MAIHKVLVFLAHPDDTDAYCPNFLAALVKAGKEIYLCSFTRGEHGLGGNRDPDKEKFRGSRLGRIRTQELVSAAAFIGIPASRLHFLDIEDSTVPNNKLIAHRHVDAIIHGINPDLVMMPEFAHGYYKHPDHVYAGMIAFLAARHYKPGIKVIFYHSMRSNYFFPVASTAFGRRAVEFHKSQTDFFRYLYPLLVNVEQVVNGIFHVQGYVRAEGLRVSSTKLPQYPGFKARIVARIFAKLAIIPKTKNV
nr:PIG-L family deacetylase [Candidatus Sigynarchaeota archaeon]